MSSLIRQPKDFWSGIIFTVAGAGAMFIAQEYSMGTAGRMGPGYFPTVLCGLLILVGLIAIVRSFRGEHSERITGFAIKPLILVLVSVILFAVLFRQAGLIAAIFSLIIVSSLASKKSKLTHTLSLALGLALFSWLVFVKILGLPLPIIGSWFNF